MMAIDAARRERVAVHGAPADLRRQCPCVVVREVSPAAGEPPLHTIIQANPYACLNVITDGEVWAGAERLPQRFLTGPWSAPLETRVPGHVRSLSLVLQPWLLAPLFAITADRLAERLVDVRSLPHPLLHALCDAAAAACASPQALSPLWQLLREACAEASEPALALADLRTGGAEAAAKAAGCSSRQYRRRYQQHMGLGPAAWLRLTRWEEALKAGLAQAPGAVRLGELAAAAGYADQAHMTRETRAISGRSPARLRQELDRGQGYWTLQPELVRIVQDSAMPED